MRVHVQLKYEFRLPIYFFVMGPKICNLRKGLDVSANEGNSRTTSTGSSAEEVRNLSEYAEVPAAKCKRSFLPRLDIRQACIYGDLFAMTLWETITYHIWHFWAGGVMASSLRSLVIPFRLLAPELQGILAAGCAQFIWVHYLSTGKPKEIEVVILRHLRNRRGINFDFIVQIAAIILGLFSFSNLWALLQASGEFSASELLRKKLAAPNLPVPRHTDGTFIQEIVLNDLFLGCLVTEYMLSMFHYYGIGLATLLRPKGVKGLLTFRLFVSPMIVHTGKGLSTGVPSLNSSVAIISAIKQQNPFALLLAAMDLLAITSVVLVPRAVRQIRCKMLGQTLIEARPSKNSKVPQPLSFRKSQDKTLFDNTNAVTVKKQN
eukprot:Gregarina_sp_Poly_1__3269@NODE_1934_length_3051_cov_211_180630_g1245_i0_p2_GENE_NODE_1934_length_3051_cov_211_180630_g1245_i0NODE_1934_length_3051_cov_211_180630_g1245_i0_p2_ORF_typecomplete_len376_score38_66_NODE_1934_length_3051_cov_211_180630_g1245_i05151642